MAIGEYEFGTDSIEIMTVVSGSMDIKLPDSNDWKTFQAGENFEVAKGVKFGVRIERELSLPLQIKSDKVEQKACITFSILVDRFLFCE